MVGFDRASETGSDGRSTAPGNPASAGGYALVVVDDDPGDTLLVKEYVADAETVTHLEVAGTLAQAAAVQLVPDCVLLDLHLPDGSDLPALARVLDRWPRAAVVVLTGLDDAGMASAAVAAGAQDHLVKGQVDATALVRRIQYAIRRKRRRTPSAGRVTAVCRPARTCACSGASSGTDRLRSASAVIQPARSRPSAVAARRGYLRRRAAGQRRGARDHRRCVRQRAGRSGDGGGAARGLADADARGPAQGSADAAARGCAGGGAAGYVDAIMKPPCSTSPAPRPERPGTRRFGPVG